MNYRRLGRTGLEVSEIGLGTSHNFMHMASSEPARCVEIVRECLDCGINFFDTAPIYGESERVLGEALEGARDKIVLATKVWESRASAARASIERSFRRLRTDVIDLLQIHNMAGWREVTPVMQAYQREGRIRHLGITDRRPDNYPELIEAMRTGAYDAIQIPYYLGEVQCREEVLPLAREMNLGVIVMRPFSHLRNGLLGPGGSIARMPELKAHHDGTPGQALLKYLLADERVSSVIPATGRAGRMSENAAASGGGALPPEIRARLEAGAYEEGVMDDYREAMRLRDEEGMPMTSPTLIFPSGEAVYNPYASDKTIEGGKLTEVHAPPAYGEAVYAGYREILARAAG